MRVPLAVAKWASLVLLALDTVVLRSPRSSHHIESRCRTETAAGNLQNLIRRTRVVFDENFLSARQLVRVRFFLKCLSPCRNGTSDTRAGRDNSK